MSNTNETLEIKQVHDNDKYIITRVITDEMSGEELCKVYGDIYKTLVDVNKQLGIIPTQIEERTKHFTEQQTVLQGRLDVFEEHVKKIKDIDQLKKEKQAEVEGVAAQQ